MKEKERRQKQQASFQRKVVKKKKSGSKNPQIIFVITFFSRLAKLGREKKSFQKILQQLSTLSGFRECVLEQSHEIFYVLHLFKAQCSTIKFM